MFMLNIMAKRALHLLLSLVGSILVGINIPWSFVFSHAIPGGGDNPAHPVLMQSIGDAFFKHFSIIHYSFDFWAGFEAFQFYFPLPYLSGAALSYVFHSHVAYKLITIFGPLFLPFSFYWMFHMIGLSRTSSLIGSLVSIPFLYTEAHVMWGGNIFSDLAGMIGNSWAFVFFPIALGSLIKSRRTGTFSYLSVFACMAACLSHFYALLMLVVAYCVFVLQDVLIWAKTKKIPTSRFYAYATGFVFVGLLTWWLLPLIAYRSQWSAEFGGDWNIDLLTTFTLPEKIAFGISVFVSIVYLIHKKFKDEAVGFFVFFSGLYTAMFFLNDIFNTSAFLNARIWPTVFFSLYVFIPMAVEGIKNSFSMPIYALFLPALWFTIPNSVSLNKATHWMKWNFVDATNTRGWPEMLQVIDLLNRQPSSRVSYESADTVNGTMGTVRMPEILPYLTKHEILLGGIVNSAPFSGIGYYHQCLMSNECAGWPNGSIMPEKDLDRSVIMMKKLGAQYHLAFREENMEFFKSNPQFEALFHGKFVGLYKLKEDSPSVEVFDSALPVLCSTRSHIALVNLPRWDSLNETGIVFKRDCKHEDLSSPQVLKPIQFVNYLIREWNSPNRVIDRGWKERQHRRMNTFLFAWRHPFDPDYSLGEGLEFFIADRGFDPDVQVVNNQRAGSELGIPLLRSTEGLGNILLQGRGYDVFYGTQQIKLGELTPVEFKKTQVGEFEAPFAWLIVKDNKTDKWPYLEIDENSDPEVRSGLPGPSDIVFPKAITSQCHATVEKSFHTLKLKTNCPGKPHLIKYTYYPKWKSNVPIELSSFGFMSLTPIGEETILRHESLPIDKLSFGITLLTGFGLLAYFVRSRLNSKRLHS